MKKHVSADLNLVCPFCGGKLLYSSPDIDIRSPEVLQCTGDCFMQIENGYENPGEALAWGRNAQRSSDPEK